MNVAIDASQVDNQDLGSGQYRYAVDLINGLVKYAPDVHLTVFGSNAAPRSEFAPAIADARRCRYVHLPPRGDRWYVYRDIARLTWRLATGRFDLLHQLHTYFPYPKPCPVVVTAYHYYEDRRLFETRPYRYYLWSLARRADAVITLSDATRGDFHARFAVPLERMRTVHCGLSPTLAAGSGTRRGKPYVLSPYNLSTPKNLRSLITAWPRIAAAHGDLELVLYGRSQLTPEREADFETLLASTAHSSRIQRVGFLSESDLAGLFAACDLFVFPTTVEGFGYPLLEAMAHGACCITRNASAMKEVGGDAVRLVETLNPDEIASATIQLLDDPASRADLGARAAQRARQFTIETMVRRTIDCYRAVV